MILRPAARTLYTRLSFPNRDLLFRASVRLNSSKQSGSAKLFADAEREESQAAAAPETQRGASRIAFLEGQHENWTGEESMQDAVLRMLLDKYKPLRSGTIQTAEQKIKQAPPRVSMAPDIGIDAASSPPPPPSATFLQPSSGSWATETLIPSTEGHRPWHTEFKVPTHSTSSIKLGIPPLSSSRSKKPVAVDERLRRKEREQQKRTEQVGRLSRAKESMLDYRLGIKKSSQVGHANPISIKGWAGLVEDKIEKARLAGLFDTVKGRGQPLKDVVEESNPFIGREEFLMNRIVQRNGAAPPWVELQGELDLAVSSFREVLRQSWTRRAIRNLTTAHPPAYLARFTLDDIRALRDPEWENRERSYHETAIEEVNGLVRNYNGLAPYAVRRSYYLRDVEVGKLYDECAEDIFKAISDRIGSGGGGNKRKVDAHNVDDGDAIDSGVPSGEFRTTIWGWLRKILAKFGW